ncbi:MAG: hypothetical protein JHC69_13885 [Akkermansiaceae bacterium]|nr:hypothetical protein [Akkermansiaceae bacterium]
MLAYPAKLKRQCERSVVGGRWSVVGLTRRGPPTCRQRREWLGNAEENPQAVAFHHTSASGQKSAGRGGPALPGMWRGALPA